MLQRADSYKLNFSGFPLGLLNDRYSENIVGDGGYWEREKHSAFYIKLALLIQWKFIISLKMKTGLFTYSGLAALLLEPDAKQNYGGSCSNCRRQAFSFPPESYS